MSFGERNWHGIVRGQGYVRVLVGRARSDMLRVTPPLTPPLTQRKNFCTTRLPFQNRSFVDFTEKSEHLDVRWGRSSWKWPFSLSKMRFALDCWGRSLWKWQFCLSKMRFALTATAFCTTRLLSENASLVDFTIVNEGYGGDLHENDCFP